MLSVIIPAFVEPFLNQTIQSLLDNAQGEVEIIPIIDGYIPNPPLPEHPSVRPIYLPENGRMRAAINAGLITAKGDYIMKADGHCAFAPGYDLALAQCAPDWLVIPRRYSLDEDTWQPKPPIWDYHYLNFPVNCSFGWAMTPQPWPKLEDSDETMTFQGSCWMVTRSYFDRLIGLLDNRPSAYADQSDNVEVGLKYWLGGGRVVVNKGTWYAHLKKCRHHYAAGMFALRRKRGNWTWVTQHWMDNEEPNIVHPFSWLVDKFWPIPTWPNDWQAQWEAIRAQL